MQVFYDFVKGGPLQTDYPNLYNRILNLQDTVLSYCRRGNLDCLCRYGTVEPDVPHVLRIGFDDTKAKRYEQTIARLLKRRLTHLEIPLPFPKFPVFLQMDICYGKEGTCVYDFSTWDDKEALTKFCAELKDRRDDVFFDMLR